MNGALRRAEEPARSVCQCCVTPEPNASESYWAFCNLSQPLLRRLLRLSRKVVEVRAFRLAALAALGDAMLMVRG